MSLQRLRVLLRDLLVGGLLLFPYLFIPTHA